MTTSPVQGSPLREPQSPRSLYAHVMGEEFGSLAEPVRRFHALSGRHVLRGRVETQAPASLAARVLALLLGTPMKAQQGDITFELEASPDGEMWTRHFPSHSMSSHLMADGRHMVEQLGAARLRFELKACGGHLEMVLQHLRFLGLPCPRWLMPHVIAREHGEADRLHFTVRASVPLLGLVAAYRGHLCLPAEAVPPAQP